MNNAANVCNKVIKPSKVLVRCERGYHYQHLANTFLQNKQKRTKLVVVASC